MTERAVRAGSPRRRLMATVALGALVLGGLAGCRSDAGTAAFVGRTRITVAQVNGVTGAIPAKYLASGLGPGRLEVAQKLVFIAIAEQYAADNHIPAPTITADLYTQFASQAQLSVNDPATNQFVITETTASLWLNQLLSHTPAGTPTDAQLRFTYDAAVNGGFLDPTTQTFDQVKSQIPSTDGYPQAAALQTSMIEWMKTHLVTINPRYQPACSAGPCPPSSIPLLEIPVQSSQFDALDLPLGAVATSPAVVDAPAAPAPAATAAAGVNAP